MSKNTKVTENKKAENKKATVAKATKTPAPKKVAEKKPAVEKPVVEKFDTKAYGQKLISEFRSDTVDLVFDSDFVDDKKGGPRAEAMNDYKYIHVFRKGTTKNCFQIYLTSKIVTIVVGKNINALMPDSDKYVKSAVIKQGKLSYYNYQVKHDNVVEVLTALVEAYKQNNTVAAEKKAAELKAKEEAKVKAKEEKAKAKEEKAKNKPKKEKTA